jgi:acylphosphatase
MTDIARHLVIRGRVQGVGFRQFMVRTAHELKITGWVRNRADGSVEAVVAGAPQAVDAIIERARRGPRNATVNGFEVTDAQAAFERFETLATV